MTDHSYYSIRVLNLNKGRTIRKHMEVEDLDDAISQFDQLAETETDCIIELRAMDLRLLRFKII